MGSLIRCNDNTGHPPDKLDVAAADFAITKIFVFL
jgi:hypothetical protein